MDIIERQMPSSSVNCPHELSRSLQKFCRAKGFEIESLEMQSDTYIIRLRRPKHTRVIIVSRKMTSCFARLRLY